jgi:hypothetical protein
MRIRVLGVCSSAFCSARERGWPFDQDGQSSSFGAILRPKWMPVLAAQACAGTCNSPVVLVHVGSLFRSKFHCRPG